MVFDVNGNHKRATKNGKEKREREDVIATWSTKKEKERESSPVNSWDLIENEGDEPYGWLHVCIYWPFSWLATNTCFTTHEGLSTIAIIVFDKSP